MSFLILDPPVVATSPVRKLRAWERELEKLATQYRGDANATTTIREELVRVRKWMEF